MRFPQAYLTKVEEDTDFFELVKKHTKLTWRGGRYWGLCPFHHEETPSFSFTVQKQVYYCFGCHKGGGLFQFVMEMNKVTFPEAVAILAKELGMPPAEDVEKGGE